MMKPRSIGKRNARDPNEVHRLSICGPTSSSDEDDDDDDDEEDERCRMMALGHVRRCRFALAILMLCEPRSMMSAGTSSSAFAFAFPAMLLPPSSFSLDGVEEADEEPAALPFAACLVNDVRADGIVVVAVRATRKEGSEEGCFEN